MRKIVMTSIAAAALMFGIVPRAEAQCSTALTGPFCIDGTITDANNSGVAGVTVVTAPVEPAAARRSSDRSTGAAPRLA